MNVSAIIVTRGDHDLGEILDSLPDPWERIIWDNHGGITIYKNEGDWRGDGPPQPDNFADLAVYGRYAAIEHATHDLIYVQDDDCVVSDPALLVRAWQHHLPTTAFADAHVVCNMPQEFRHSFYEDHALVGFGACFHRDAPKRAFDRLGLTALPGSVVPDIDFFHRTCDVAFTALTPRVLVDVPVKNLPWANAPDRMWKQPEHVAERARMLELVKGVRDAGS